MKHRQRIYYTEKDKALMWDRWQKGESLHSIARHFGRGSFVDPESTRQDLWHPAFATPSVPMVIDAGVKCGL